MAINGLRILTGCFVALLVLIAVIIPDGQYRPLVKGVYHFFKRSSFEDVPLLLRSFHISPECRANGYFACYEAREGLYLHTLEWRNDYVCYRFRKTCRKQASGGCGWEKDEEDRVQKCLERREYLYD